MVAGAMKLESKTQATSKCKLLDVPAERTAVMPANQRSQTYHTTASGGTE